jgi:hypothetical protein
MVAVRQRIASAYAVIHGSYGQVVHQARSRGVSRQWLYREAALVEAAVEGTEIRRQLQQLRQQINELQEQNAHLHKRLAQAVVIDEDKQKEFATVAHAVGNSLPEARELLGVLMEHPPSVAQLGRWTKEAGQKAAALLAVLDEVSRKRVQQAAADEIYVRAPVMMVVDSESLCWVSGRMPESLSGAAWAEEFRGLTGVQQVTRDAGLALRHGMSLHNAARKQQGLAPVADQLDHFHSLRELGLGVRRSEMRVRKALASAEKADQKKEKLLQQGKNVAGATRRSQLAWRKAEQAMSAWEERQSLAEQVKQAVQLITAEGELNTRARAEAVLQETLPRLPDKDFAKAKRLLRQRQTLTFLDVVQQKLAALPLPAEVWQAAVRQEALRRRPEALQADTAQAAVLRGVLLMCAVILSKAGAVGEQALAAVRTIFRQTWRASSLVEGINSVLRMHQARHRKVTQGMLDLKRLYWNCRPLRTGRRKGQCPYQRVGLPWPDHWKWRVLLKMTPEQLRAKVSTWPRAA